MTDPLFWLAVLWGACSGASLFAAVVHWRHGTNTLAVLNALSAVFFLTTAVINLSAAGLLK